MRFHHSTRRGRNRFSQAAGGGGGNHHLAGGGGGSCGTGGKFGGHPSALSNRWAQLSYCRQTNLHFNRRLPVELPDEMRHDQLMRVLSDRTGKSANQSASQQETRDEKQQDLLVLLPNPSPSPGQDQHHQHQQIENRIEQLDKLTLGANHPVVETSTTTGGGHHNTKLHHRKSKHQPNHKPHVGPSRSSQNLDATPTSGSTNDNKQNHHQQPTATTTKLDLESARAKLIAQVDKHPFWSNKAAKRMRLLELTERQVYIYELTSYCERRDLEWRYKPYRGGKLGASSTVNIAPTTPAASSGKRPVLSSVSELSGRPSRNLTAGGGGGGGGGQSRRVAASQRASPPPATPSGDCNPQHLMSIAWTAANSGQQRPSKFDFEIPAGSDFNQRNITAQRQSIRRSCSSATSSPVKAAVGAAQPAGSQTAAHSPTSGSPPPAFGAPLTPPGLLASPRPVPSADFVWSIEPPEPLRPQPFASYVHTSEVPGTSFLKKCHGCEGRGRLKCSSCYGVGYEVCLSCTGKGSLRTYSSSGGGGGGGSALGRSLGPRGDAYSSSGGRGDSGGGSSMWDNAASDLAGARLGGSGRYDEPGGITSGGGCGGGGGLSSASEVCASCSGMGQKRCWICAGRSYITCTACAGTGTLRCHLNLNITYLNHRDELCLNNSDGIIPRERLKLTSGLLLADEIADRLEPIGSSSSRYSQPLPREGATSRLLLEEVAKPTELGQLNAMSARLLEKHAESYLRSERLIKQRHKVTQIECFKIDWEFRKKRGHFVVYGDERKVYIAKYPFKSICNIT